MNPSVLHSPLDSQLNSLLDARDPIGPSDCRRVQLEKFLANLYQFRQSRPSLAYRSYRPEFIGRRGRGSQMKR